MSRSRVRTYRRGRVFCVPRGLYFRVEINLGNLKRVVPEPTLNSHQVEARAQPVGSRGFPKPLKEMLLSYWASLARYLDFMAIVVSTRLYRQRLILKTDIHGSFEHGIG